MTQVGPRERGHPPVQLGLTKSVSSPAVTHLGTRARAESEQGVPGLRVLHCRSCRTVPQLMQRRRTWGAEPNSFGTYLLHQLPSLRLVITGRDTPRGKIKPFRLWMSSLPNVRIYEMLDNIRMY